MKAHNQTRKGIWIMCFFFVTLFQLKAQDTLNKKRLAISLSAVGTGYVGSMTGLGLMWYKDYPMSSFHLFNDNDEWLQMDKVGHFMVSYYVGQFGYEVLRWSGVERKKAIWWGGTWGLIFQTGVEVLDGFSANWGASMGDVIGNTMGTAAFIGQQLAWDEQRITFKYSFYSSQWRKYRPNVLGSNYAQRLLKDYNGQIAWMSVDVASFLPEESKWPNWLGVSLGYGVDGLTGGTDNPEFTGIPNERRGRQYYLSGDILLDKINWRNKRMRNLIKFIGWFKIPLPSLELTHNGKIKFHPLGVWK